MFNIDIGVNDSTNLFIITIYHTNRSNCRRYLPEVHYHLWETIYTQAPNADSAYVTKNITYLKNLLTLTYSIHLHLKLSTNFKFHIQILLIRYYIFTMYLLHVQYEAAMYYQNE